MAGAIRLVRDMDFEYGRVDKLSNNIRRVIANNPSAFTFHGTGTYILGQGEVAVIDPGPADEAHVSALLAALKGEVVTHILVTHTHQDHSPATPLLQAHFNAPAFAYGPHGSGMPADAVQLEEGGDMNFQPDETMRHGDIIQGKGWSVQCVYTPGHTSNHMCYQLREEKALFTGDHVMGWSTSVIVPPDGDMQAYMNSLEMLLERDDVIYWPTHGPAITETKAHVQSFIDHRLAREAQIIVCIEQGQQTIGEIVSDIYRKHSPALYPAASMSVLAAIIHLVVQGKIACDDEAPHLHSVYRSV